MQRRAMNNGRVGRDDGMPGANNTPRCFNAHCAIFLHDLLYRGIGKEKYLALCTGFGHPRQIFERVKRRLPGIAQHMAAVASPERDTDQTLDRRAYCPNGIELLVDYVGRHIVTLEQVAVQPPEVAIKPFGLLDFLNTIDRRGLAFIEELRLLFSKSQAGAVDRIEEIQKAEGFDCDFRR